MGIVKKWYNEKKTIRRKGCVIQNVERLKVLSIVLRRRNTIRRRRECDECQHRFTTYERVEERTLVVVKKKMAHGNNSPEIKSLMGLSISPETSQSMNNMVVNRIEQTRGRNEMNKVRTLVPRHGELAELDEIYLCKFPVIIVLR